MDHDFLNLADAPPFIEKDWINAGKQYPIQNTPYEVQWARDQLLEVPTTFLHHLPARDLPVTEFLRAKLPHQSSQIITTKARTWFNHDAPTTDVRILMNRPIPPPTFLANLEKELGQAWFDGAKSIVDHRFNNSMDRFPLWVVAVWRMLSDAVGMQTTWRRGYQWLDNEEKKTRDPATIEAIHKARERLTSLGWDVRLAYQRGTVTTAHLATLLGTGWLNDEHIDMMMEELSKQITSDPELCDKIIIAPLAFARQACNAKGKKYSRQTTPLFCRYEKHTKEANVKELYFPVNINTNHWIAGLIDFERSTISYGMLSSKHAYF